VILLTGVIKVIGTPVAKASKNYDPLNPCIKYVPISTEGKVYVVSLFLVDEIKSEVPFNAIFKEDILLKFVPVNYRTVDYCLIYT
jgi:hypothetical protein